MLTVEQYFGKWANHPDVTPDIRANAINLVNAVNPLIDFCKRGGIEFPINPSTGCIVSGTTLGGFRPQSCTIGAPQSAHKQGLAVDIYDPHNEIDVFLEAHIDQLAQFGLWFEASAYTNGWSHWSIKQPKSGRRFFIP